MHACVQVTDETINPFDPPYPFSDIVRAVDYGVGNGARIFSMSFGNNAQSDMQSYFKAELDRAANAYRDLFRKYQPYGTLFLAAAGENSYVRESAIHQQSWAMRPVQADVDGQQL